MNFWKTYEKLCLNYGKRASAVGKELGISTGAISQWKNGSIPSGEKLVQIADYFGVSTDYLLGRTEEPQNSPEASIIKGNVNNSTNFGNHNSISLSATAEAENEISSILSNLTPRARTELMMMIYQFADKHTA